jgi:O-antigen chain-terminating methyltransferase
VLVLDTFEIPDEEINVEEIMRKIKEKIQMRTGREVLPKSEDILFEKKAKKSRELEYVNSNWDIQNNNYSISSHRPILGKALITGRKIVHREVQLYIDPVIQEQIEFNSNIVTILNEINERLGRISSQVEDKIAQSQSTISAQIEDKVKNVVTAMNVEIENRASLADILDKRIAKGIEGSSDTIMDNHAEGLNYFVFEERFRGSRADIKGRQSAFIKYFNGCKNVLDIGCGRGEFLELLKEHEIGGRGIDVDEDMVNFCKSKGFDVERIDAVSYLDKLEDNSLGGIFIDQVVVHLEPDYLIRMLSLCYKKLICGGTIIAETVNPLSFFSFANFYIDMSHKRPVHPETLKFLTNAAGFRETEIELMAPVPEDAKLKKIKINAERDQQSEEVGIYNNNIDMLNSIIYGPQDYALIGKK